MWWEYADPSSPRFRRNGNTSPIPTPQLLDRVVDMLDNIPMDDRDTTGDLYEYLLAKIASARVNGQFRTPRHIIKLMVDLMAPAPTDSICDPVCGTAGFLVAASDYLWTHHQRAWTDEAHRANLRGSTFHGYDFDSTMLRIGSMNMMVPDRAERKADPTH